LTACLRKNMSEVSETIRISGKPVLAGKGLVTRAISCAISCAICCISQMRFGASAIWCPTRIPFYLFLHKITNANWFAIPCPFCSCAEIVHAPNRTANRTQNWMLCVIGNNSVSDTKSQMQQIADAICSKSHMKSHTKSLV
jgi:hypothetical protein